MLSSRLAAWNRRLNGIPRKAALVAAVLGAAVLGAALLPYGWPFAVAFLLSRMLEPFVRFAAKGFWRIRLKRSVASAVGTALLFGIAGVLVSALITRLVQELIGAAKHLPQMIAWAGRRPRLICASCTKGFKACCPHRFPRLWKAGLAN